MENAATIKTNLSSVEPIGPFVMAVMSIIVGVVGGLGAIIFRALIGITHNVLFYGSFNINYDANLHSPPTSPIWWIIFVPVIGSIGVTWLVQTFAPEARGHGVPEVMDAIYNKEGHIRPVVAIVKSLASALSIGSGGSVGREGPIVQIGAAMGSTIGRLLHMPPRQKVILIAAGAGAGIAATFNTPIGGLAFATELMLVSINVTTITLVSLATVTACYIGQMYFGALPAFNVHQLEVYIPSAIEPFRLLLYVPFGIIIGIAAAVFIRSIYWAEDFFDALPMNAYFRHMLGMLILGLLLYFFMQITHHYYIQGVGYATIQDILRSILNHPWFLLLLFVAKLLATGLTLGSGASGGVFSPSLFLGATLGAAFGHALQYFLPYLDIHPAIFALAGMAAMVAGTTGAVLTGIIMILEMTYDYNAVLPMMVTVAIALSIRVVLSPRSIYTLKVRRRGGYLPEGLQAQIRTDQSCKDVMCKRIQIVKYNELHGLSGEEKHQILTKNTYAIIEKDGDIYGILPNTARMAFQKLKEINLEEWVSKEFLTISSQSSLMNLMRLRHKHDIENVIVMSSPQSHKVEDVLGIITLNEIAKSVESMADIMSG